MRLLFFFAREGVNPKIAQMGLDEITDGSFVRNLEANGFMTELRKKVR
jgi:hypothetical protein